MLPFLISLSFSPYTGHASMIWEITGYHPFQFHHHWTRLLQALKQLPQGDQSNLVYSSSSIHSSNLAQVITTSLSSLKSSPKVLSQKKLPLAQLFAFWTLIETNAESVCPCISWKGLCLFSRCRWPSAVCSPRTHQSHEHTSVAPVQPTPS